jgi:hypothetical protein
MSSSTSNSIRRRSACSKGRCASRAATRSIWAQAWAGAAPPGRPGGGAAQLYTCAVEIDPQYDWAWSGRGLTLSALDRHNDALYCFQRAAEIDPSDVWYWYNQGDEQVTMNRIDEALTVAR